MMWSAVILMLCLIHSYDASNTITCPLCVPRANSQCPMCVNVNHQCNTDTDCGIGYLCCSNPSCGRYCLRLPGQSHCRTCCGPPPCCNTCGYSMCCPKECGKECTVKRKWGLCPTFTDKPASVCVEVRIDFQCGGNDADCAGTKKCCPNICGSRQCREPATKPRPECPSRFSQTKAAACHFDECSHDKECTKGKICCDVTCGIGCTEPNVS